MRLLLNKDLAQQQNKLHERDMLVISSRADVAEHLAQHIGQAGMGHVKVLETDFLSAPVLTLAENLQGVLIDIGGCTDVDQVVNQVKGRIPQQCWCILFGDSDSISVAQGFVERGMRYFHVGSQLAEITARVLSGPGQEISTRKSLLITLLGCKGGAGSSLLSWQLAQSIVRYRKLPLLLLQGNLGSQDIDIMLGKKIDQGITSHQEYIDVMLSESLLPPESDAPDMQKYNFLIFDQALFSTTKEVMQQQAEHSHCIILVLDRTAASARVALNFINIFERIADNGSQGRRLFICVNDSRPVTSDSLSLSDMQSLLGRPITVSFPYLKEGSQALLEHKLWRGDKKPLEKLTRLILGMGERRQGSSLRRSLSLHSLSRHFR